MIWCDNIFIIAANSVQFHIMLRELTEAIYRSKLRWKSKSLGYLVAGPLVGEGPPFSIVTPDGCVLNFTHSTELHVLGAALDCHGSTWCSVNHRMLKGEACFWAQATALCNKGSVSAKLQAWSSGPAACALHGASSWHAAQDLLLGIKRWEFRWLRRILKLKRKPEESNQKYNRRILYAYWLGAVRPDAR